MRAIFERWIKGDLLVLPSNVVVPWDKFEKIFEAVPELTYDGFQSVNFIGLDEHGSRVERGYDALLREARDAGLI